MFAHTENSTTFVTVNDKQTFTKPPGLAKARQTLFPGIKEAGITGIPAGKKKDKLS